MPWHGDTFATVNMPGLSSTTINCIGLAGFYIDAKGNTDGLLALPWRGHADSG